MSKVAKQDWAERKARRVMLDEWQVARCAEFLRAERARAVRVCRKQAKLHVATSTDFSRRPITSYLDACDDCAAAIRQ